MRIIPAIDIIDGKCVRLTRGDYNTQKNVSWKSSWYSQNFEANGIRYLHLVDLDGAKSKHIVNHRVLYEIASGTSLKIDFGGGIKSDDDVRIAFENGAEQITGGSIAVQQPELFSRWLSHYGPDKIILGGADSHHRKIATHGWQRQSDTDVVDFISEYEKKEVFVTPSVQIYRKTECWKALLLSCMKRYLTKLAFTLLPVAESPQWMIFFCYSKLDVKELSSVKLYMKDE